MALAAGLALAGCRLIDQTTFGARPEAPAPDQLTLALREPGRVPLVVIRFDAAQTTYAEALDGAIDAAVDRKPDVAFDVVSMIPGSQAQKPAAVALAQQDATGVMDQMVDAGANPENIHFAARIDPTLTAREVRVYVH